MHHFLAAYVRYATHLGAYLALAANPYPGFTGEPGYPVDVEIPAREPQSRWKIALRIFLAIPALLARRACSARGFGGGGGGHSGAIRTTRVLRVERRRRRRRRLRVPRLVRRHRRLGRMPLGLRNLAAYGLGYTAQAYSYALLLTDRYPNSDPDALGPTWELPAHPVRSTSTTTAARSRLTVFFRLLLAIPHFVWLALWSVAAYPRRDR